MSAAISDSWLYVDNSINKKRFSVLPGKLLGLIDSDMRAVCHIKLLALRPSVLLGTQEKDLRIVCKPCVLFLAILTFINKL
jgi:hypothetical protein